ncbi:MAG: metal-dependent hydrolase [Nanoarchaeota archaeon]|nr:metal-dependent hydrolase [Nanoarchaeota archaeon]
MSNAQGHLIAGTLVSLSLAFVLYNLLHVGLLVVILGIIVGIISSEFPDIDHPKSLPRKVLRGIMPAIVIFTFIYLFFSWRIWTHGLFEISLFFAAPLLIIMFYEYFIPRHRGATHKWPGMATMVALSVSMSFVAGLSFVNVITITLFAVLGFSSHILLDHL